MRELMVFSVIGKAIELKSIDYRFESCSPHHIDLRIRTKWERILRLNEHENAGKPINYIPSSASHNHNVQWVIQNKGKTESVYSNIGGSNPSIPTKLMKNLGM